MGFKKGEEMLKKSGFPIYRHLFQIGTNPGRALTWNARKAEFEVGYILNLWLADMLNSS